MSISRRRFLQNTAIATIGCAAKPLFAGSHTKVSGKPADDGNTMISAPGRQLFSGAVGSSFEVSSKDQPEPVWLQLLAVEDLPARSPVNTASMAVPPPKHTLYKNTSGFMLLFSGGPQELAQGTYNFQNTALGRFSLFIVPGGNGTQLYWAIFNHI